MHKAAILFGLLLIAIGLINKADMSIFMLNAKQTEAVVTKNDYGGGDKLWIVYTEYVVDGKVYEASGKHTEYFETGMPGTTEKGTILTIYYSPRNPGNYRLPNSGEPVLPIFIGAIITSVALINLKLGEYI